MHRATRHAAILPLLFLHIWLALGGSSRVGLTADEGIHITAGFYYQKTGDYRFQPENGNLPQRLLALPWLHAELKPAPADNRHREQGYVWGLSDELIDQAGERWPGLLRQSRLITALASATVLVVVYAWALGLFGFAGAWVAVLFAAFCPNLVAHAGLATSDVWGVLGGLLATLAGWRLCHRISPGRIIAAGLGAGFFAVCKFSCVLLAPVAVVMFLARLARRADLPCSLGPWRTRLRGWHRVPALLFAAGSVGLLMVGVIWAAYGFRYEATPAGEGRFQQTWEKVLIDPPEFVGLLQLGDDQTKNTVLLRRGMLPRGIAWARHHRLLPEAWLYGLAFVGRNAQSRLSYLAGEYRLTGWREYFPIAFTLKTPLGGLLALALAALAWSIIPRRGRLGYRMIGPAALFAMVLGFAIFSRINIGLRHVLPAITLLWLGMGAVGRTREGRARRVLLISLGAAALAQAAATVRSSPHTLTYFNPIAGASPDYWLVDSNLDWGQGLPELRLWLDTNPEKRPAFLSYFGADIPGRHGFDLPRFADLAPELAIRALPADLSAGWYCFGPTQYRRAYTRTRGPWTQTRETLYQSLLLQVLNLAKTRETEHISDPIRREQIALLDDFDVLRFARLCFYLDGRPPDHRLPGGIMVFHLTDQDLQTAFYAPLHAISGAIMKRMEVKEEKQDRK